MRVLRWDEPALPQTSDLKRGASWREGWKVLRPDIVIARHDKQRNARRAAECGQGTFDRTKLSRLANVATMDDYRRLHLGGRKTLELIEERLEELSVVRAATVRRHDVISDERESTCERWRNAQKPGRRDLLIGLRSEVRVANVCDPPATHDRAVRFDCTGFVSLTSSSPQPSRWVL
jgi:hypothetical protein